MRAKIIIWTSLFLILGTVTQTPRALSRIGMALTARAMAPPAPRPDLAIIKVTFVGNQAHVRLKNIGQAASNPCNLALSFLKGQTADSGEIETWNQLIPALAVGRDIALTVSIGNRSFSGRGVLVTLDSKEILTEVTRSNNTYFRYIASKTPADLAAQDVYISDSTNQIIGTVKNIGSGNYSGSREARLICITIFSSHQKYDVLGTFLIPSLGPNQSFTLKGTKPAYKGVVKYKLQVEIAEGDINSDNDTIQKIFTKTDNN